jgi:uroporphyrinogen-III decarboxylase
VEELLDIMHARRMEEYEIVARRADVLALIPVENTSTTLISPALYRRLSLPQMRDFMTVAHRHGRKAILHMCGLLKGLVAPLRETGLDGINGLTPPTVGDLPFEAALDGFGPDLVIWGGILDGTVFNAPNATREDIRAALDRTFTPRVRQSRFLLWAPADGLPVPVERFFAVRDWMDENGTL